MVNTIAEARKIYEQKNGRRDLLLEQHIMLINRRDKTQNQLDVALKARAIIQLVATNTQRKIELRISQLVTMALAAVFPDPYEFQLKFDVKRNNSEAITTFIKNGNQIDNIFDAGGGGVADIANIALTISLWSLNKTRNSFIFDEPDKFIHNAQYQERTSEMLKMLCDKLNIQIIIVSDQPNIMAFADKIFRVSNKSGQSHVEEVKNEK